MKKQILGQIVVYFLLIQMALGGLNYDVISYTTSAQVKVDGKIVENPYHYFQSDPYLEQFAGASTKQSISSYGDCSWTNYFCQADASWEEEQEIAPYVGKTIYAGASIILEFRPHGNHIEIGGGGGIYEPPYGAWWYFSLTDKTTGKGVFSADEYKWSPGPHDGYPINPAHTYELSMYASTTLLKPGSNGAQTELYFMVTPEPASLLILCLGGLLCRKIRIHSKR